MKNNKSRYAILGALTWGPQSGYDIRKNIETSVGNFWSEGYGQIYPLLKELVAEALVTRAVEAQKGKPDRHVYTLTKSGLDQLRQWLQEPAEMQTGRIEILLKLFFGRQIAMTYNLEQVRHFQNSQRFLLDKYEVIERELQASHPTDPNLPYWLITLRYGKHITRALLLWAEETSIELDALTDETHRLIPAQLL